MSRGGALKRAQAALCVAQKGSEMEHCVDNGVGGRHAWSIWWAGGLSPGWPKKLHGGGSTEETPEEGSRRHCSHAAGKGGQVAAGRKGTVL